jgi:hypothetical protein
MKPKENSQRAFLTVNQERIPTHPIRAVPAAVIPVPVAIKETRET